MTHSVTNGSTNIHTQDSYKVVIPGVKWRHLDLKDTLS